MPRAALQRAPRLLRAAAAAGSGASGLAAASRERRRWGATACQAQRGQPQRPVAGTSGSCDSGVRFYAARSRAAKESASCFAIAERLHQFAVVDGARAGGEPSSREATQRCAQFCAGQLSRLVSYAFAEQARQGALGSEGAEAVAEAEASGAFDAWGGGAAQAPEVTRAVSAWASALQDGFALCEQSALQQFASEQEGGCGALLCVVARSGVYVASVGLGRAVVGTEEEEGSSIICDEVSNPHCVGNDPGWVGVTPDGMVLPELPEGAQTRMLGAAAAKRLDQRLTAQPDVVRHDHADARRFVILGSPGVWTQGPRLPLQWAVEAYRSGRSPADELVRRSEGDTVALVLVLPPGLGGAGGPLPPHGALA